MAKRNFQFEVETIHQDPPAQYKDRHFRYTVENKSDFKSEFDDDEEVVIKKFCMTIVHPAVDKDNRLQGQSYIERFEKTKDRTYEYWVIEPNTD
jgi:hypothetical protein